MDIIQIYFLQGKKLNVDLVKKAIGAFKLFRSLDIVKKDSLPVEILENVFIGSLGAAINRKALEECKITHVIVAAKAMQQYHPEVKRLFCFCFN